MSNSATVNTLLQRFPPLRQYKSFSFILFFDDSAVTSTISKTCSIQSHLVVTKYYKSLTLTHFNSYSVFIIIIILCYTNL